MELSEFVSLFERTLPVGTVIRNPGGGTSTVLSYVNSRVCYRRGHSRMYAQLAEFHRAYKNFEGSRVTSKALKAFLPAVFDSAARPSGHNCHCTFLFCALHKMGLADAIEGRGRVGDPFAVNIVKHGPLT